MTVKIPKFRGRCVSGKIGYRCRQDADADREIMNRCAPIRVPLRSSYRCEICGLHHLTSMTQTKGA